MEMECEYWEGVPVWDKKEIKEVARKQLNFLGFIFPFLKEDGWHQGVVEVRPISRDRDAKYVESFNVFRIDADTVERYIKFLEKINGKPYCLYYSSYCFDNKITVEGKKKQKINNESALATNVLGMDFDHITVEQFAEIKKIFNQLNLSTLDIFSGHGVQSLIVLNELCYDVKLLKRWTTLLIRKGIKTDQALIDPARVLRMPYSYNCKAFDVQSNYHIMMGQNEGIPTEILNKPIAKYPLSFVFEKIMGLKDIIPALENENQEIIRENFIIEKKPITEVTTKNKTVKEKTLLEIKETNKEEVREAYVGLINVSKLPLPVLKMLNHTPDGLRNKTLLFIVPYLKNSLGFKKEDIINVLTVWGERCTPKLDSASVTKDVTRLLKNYKLIGSYGKYDNELAANFGFLDFKLQRENKVKIQNQITNQLNDISDGAFKIFLAIANFKSLNKEKQNFTIDEICKISKITIKTFYNNIKDLTTNGILTKNTKVSKKKNENYRYYINPYLSDYAGFTLLERATIELMLLILNDPEIKLYSFMCSMVYSKEEIWSGQKYLAGKVGKAQTTVCGLLIA